MSSITPPHAACVKRLNELFFLRLAQTVTVGIQDSVRLNNTSEPQPDISLLQRRPDFYETQQPQPENVFLLIPSVKKECYKKCLSIRYG